MTEVKIHTDEIQLDQLLKLAGVVNSGGEVKYLVADKKVFLNGEPVTARRKKIKIGDIVKIGGSEIKVAAE
jgi:ribosome-associated protein